MSLSSRHRKRCSSRSLASLFFAAAYLVLAGVTDALARAAPSARPGRKRRPPRSAVCSAGFSPSRRSFIGILRADPSGESGRQRGLEPAGAVVSLRSLSCRWSRSRQSGDLFLPRCKRGDLARGVVLSFASALLQALVAVLIVGIAAALLNATASTMSSAVNTIEILSYSLIILIGVRLLWVKGRAFIAAAQTLHRPAALSAAATPLPQHTGLRPS